MEHLFRLSEYVRLYIFKSDVLMYNTINGRIVILPNDCIHNVHTLHNIPFSLKHYLVKHYFQEGELPWTEFEGIYEQNNHLRISLETFLSCNLKCPYCYQINNNFSKSKISRGILDNLFLYIKRVYDVNQFSRLSLKVLGGEPTIDWTPAKYVLDKIKDFCLKRGIWFELRVDTNCTNIECFRSIPEFDSVIFTVPLCHKTIHDKYRHFNNGDGTFERIINNVHFLSEIPNSTIILRHNTDIENIELFDSYLNYLQQHYMTAYTVMPQYTTNPDYGNFHNNLTYYQYVDWLSSSCIDSLIRNGFNVAFYPRMLLNGKCQQWDRYSIKLFSDGRVGACAAHFFDKNNPTLQQILDCGIENITNYWGGTKSFEIFSSNCRKCSSLFGCAGHYRLPCIKELGINKCDPETSLYLNWAKYFEKVYDYFKLGFGDRFQHLNIKAVRR